MADLDDNFLVEDDYMSEDDGFSDHHGMDQDTADSELDDNEDDALGLSEIREGKPPHRSYNVDFTILSLKDVQKQQDAEISKIANIFGVLPTQAATLLRHFHWKDERLIENYMDAPERTLLKAGVILDVNRLPKIIPAPRGFVCDICCNDDEDDMQTIALLCGHRFCTECYARYLEVKVCVENESRNVQCAAAKCAVIIDQDTVKLLCKPQVYDRYVELLNRTYVDDNPSLRWCPAPNCEYVADCPSVPQSSLHRIVPTVVCVCGMRFCHGCGMPDHQPCICAIAKLWLQKCADDSETANWISANTKECHKCKSTIEKNGGCNHMTCKKCKYEFCWVCLGPWAEHGNAWYNCNRFDETSGKEARDAQSKSRAFLERYLHYYNRYANHEQSARLDEQLYKKIEVKMEDMQRNSDLSWIECQFLRHAVDVLMECRTTLKWTYAFAYYLERNNQTELFEDNQRDLELAVEHLSGMLEMPVEDMMKDLKELKRKMQDKAKYVEDRRDILLEDTAVGLLDDRWRYNVQL